MQLESEEQHEYREDDNIEELCAQEEAWAFATLRDFSDVIRSFGSQFIIDGLDQEVLDNLFADYVNQGLDKL